MATETKAVAVKPIDNLKDLLDRAMPAIKSVIPSYLDPYRLLQVALVAASRSSKLLQCTPESFLQSVMQAAELGLEAGGPLGHAYLVPFKNKHTGKLDCQLIVGYKGYIDLAHDNGQEIEARVVREKDQFRMSFGTSPELFHSPSLEADPGPVIGAYAIAKIKDAEPKVEWMSLAQLEAIRKRSKSPDEGPYATDREEMYRKAPVRRIQKYLDLSPRQRKAMEYDREALDIDYDVLAEAEPPLKEAKAKEATGQAATQTTTTSEGQAVTAIEVDPQASRQAADELSAEIRAARDRKDEAALAALGVRIIKLSETLTNGDLQAIKELHTASLAALSKGGKR